MALGIDNPQKEDDLAFMDQLLTSASSATGVKKEANTKPASALSQVNDPDLQAMDQLIQSAQKGVPETAQEKQPTIGETLQQSGFHNVSEELANVAKEETDPEEIKKFPQWFEKTPEQIDYLYAHRKNQSIEEAASKAVESAVGGAPAMVGSIATGFGQIISDVASVNPARMTAAPGGEEKAIRAIKAFPESVANTFEHLWRQGKNIAERGLTSADQALVSMGLKTEEEAKKNFRDREYFNTHNAQYDEENPDVAARAIDASRPVTQNALRAIVSNLSASVDQILAKHPDWTREQAVQYKNQQDEHLSQDYINRAIAYQNKTAPTEEELFATGLVVPAGNEFSMAIKAFEGAGKVIKFAGKGFKAPTAAEESAANAATQSEEALAFADRAKKKGDIGPVEKYAQIVADSISKGGQKLEQALESVPEFYRPMVKAYLPLASLELGGAGVGALAEPEDRVGGILKGMGLASTLYAPRVVADLAKARRTLAGAPGDMFSVAMATPESSLATKAISYFPSRKLPFLNESVINWTANNIKDFVRTGAETVPLGIALGIYNDQDAEGVGETLANGAIFAYSHGAITKATGKSPYEAQRYRKQKDYENYKLMSRLPEGDRARLESAANWNEVIADSKAKLDESTKNYAELYNKDPQAPETLKAAAEVTKDKGIYEMNQRASVATRQEYTRQVVGVLSSIDRRINGPMSPGRNFNIRLMGKDEIAQKLMDVNPGMDKQTADFFANNAGARYAASGQIKMPNGQMAGTKAQGVIFDPMRDTAVINMDKIRDTQSVTGRPLAWVLSHEADHIANGFKEYRDVTQPLREKLFGKKVFLPDGSVVPGTEGAYSTEMLNDMFLNSYLKTRTTPQQKEEFAKNNNLWDYQKQDYDPLKVASYMQEEILAEANAAGLGANQVGGKGMARLNSPLQNIIDWALVSNENNRLAKLIKKGAFLGVKDPFITSGLTGATFTPEMLAHVRRNNIALNEFNGVLTPHDGSDIAPEIKPNDIKNNRALAEEFAKDDGKFKTTKIGEVVDADGNVVYRHLITNPEAAEGEWKSSDDAERKPVRVKGYGQMPEELTTQMIPEGGSMRVVSQIVYDEKGKPVERDKNAYKALIQARSQMIRDAILKHDQDNPEAMRPFSADNLSLRGKLTQNQITEILNLPESIVPLSIKEKIAMARDIIDRGDGTPTIGMYASRLSSTGKYKPFSPKIVQSKPISLSFSKDGHFLVNEFNVTGARDKANLILKYQPEVLKLWNYDPNEFLKGLSKYMENWKNDPAEMDPLSEQAAQTRHRNLDEDFNKAMQMRYVYDAFLNVKPPKDEARPMNFNPVVITLPKIKRSQMTKDEKADFRSSDPMSLIRSRRLDAYSHYEQSNGTKYPFEYGKSIFNAMPEAQIDPEAALEMKPAKPSRETTPTISSPILRGINAIQGKDSGQMGSSFAPSGEKQSFGAQFTPEFKQTLSEISQELHGDIPYSKLTEEQIQRVLRTSQAREYAAQNPQLNPDERVIAATYTDPETGKVTEAPNHRLANPNAPAREAERETPEYGFKILDIKTGETRIASRLEAYKIASAGGQITKPKWSEGILHSSAYEPYVPYNKDAYTDRDADWSGSLGAGDLESAQEYVDQEAYDSGFLGVGYKAMMGNVPNMYNQGKASATYLATDRQFAEPFAKGDKPIRPVFFDESNIFDFRDPEHVKQIFQAIDDGVISIPRDEEKYKRGLKLGQWSVLEEPFIREWIQNNNYDGFYLLESPLTQPRNSPNVALFDLSMVKSSEPATYDRDGNLIPLSERFKRGVANVNFSPEFAQTESKSVDDVISHIRESSKSEKGDVYQTQQNALKSLPQVSEDTKKKLTSKKAIEDGGQEHQVHYDPENKTWLKMTVGGKYGTGMKDTPAEYLENLKRLDELSGGALGYKVSGIVAGDPKYIHPLPPRIVTQVNHIEGNHPKTMEETNEILKKFGFKQLFPGPEMGVVEPWISPDGKYVIRDLHLGNIILAPHPEHGTIPVIIDGWVTPNENAK